MTINLMFVQYRLLQLIAILVFCVFWFSSVWFFLCSFFSNFKFGYQLKKLFYTLHFLLLLLLLLLVFRVCWLIIDCVHKSSEKSENIIEWLKAFCFPMNNEINSSISVMSSIMFKITQNSIYIQLLIDRLKLFEVYIISLKYRNMINSYKSLRCASKVSLRKRYWTQNVYALFTKHLFWSKTKLKIVNSIWSSHIYCCKENIPLYKQIEYQEKKHRQKMYWILVVVCNWIFQYFFQIYMDCGWYIVFVNWNYYVLKCLW